MFKNKKGIGMLLYDLAAMFLIFLVLIAFFLFVTILPKSNTVSQSLIAKDKIEVNTALLNYLRTPITIENKEILVSDLIRFYTKDRTKYEYYLKDVTQKTIYLTFDNYRFYINGEMISEGKEEFYTGGEYYGRKYDPGITTFTISLPDYNKNIEIKLEVQ